MAARSSGSVQSQGKNICEGVYLLTSQHILFPQRAKFFFFSLTVQPHHNNNDFQHTSTMDQTVLGHGIFTASRMLAALVENPQDLDQARQRFCRPPPTYISHDSTEPLSPNPPDEETQLAQRRSQRKWQLIQEHRASFPSNQLAAEIGEEEDWQREQSENRGRAWPPVGTSSYRAAEATVKARWAEQDIWDDNWKKVQVWRWKHEEMPAKHEADVCPPPKCTEAESGRLNSAADMPSVEEQRAIRERKCAASRPFHQFIYQVSTERSRIEDEMRYPPSVQDLTDLNLHRFGLNGNPVLFQPWPAASPPPITEAKGEEAPTSIPRDINSRAYERVRAAWTKRGVWNEQWGVLPGMAWKHEQPLTEMLREEMGAEADLVPKSMLELEDETYRTDQAPCQPIFRAVLATVEPSDQLPDVQSSPQQELDAPRSDIANASPAGSCVIMSPVGNGLFASPAGHDLFTSSAGKGLFASSGGKGLFASLAPFIDNRQTPSITPTVLGPIHSSKVSRTRGKTRDAGRRRQIRITESAPESDVAQPTPEASPTPPPRRSRRLQDAEHKTILSMSADTEARPQQSRSKPGRGRISAGSRSTTKARGLSKSHTKKPQRVVQ